MKDNDIIIYRNKYKVDTNNVNFNRKLGLFGTLGLLQDMAGEHANILGFGYKDMIAGGYFWVLTQQKLKMDRWPDWHDEVEVVTWALPVEGLKAYREFEIFVDGEKIGQCSTTWMTLDLKSRKPLHPDFINEKGLVRKDYTVGFNAGRVSLPDNLKQSGLFTVYNSDIDMNRHVNNTRYTKWILDSIPIEYHSSLILEEFEINFLSETFLGDNIIIENSESIPLNSESFDIFYSGTRQEDGKKLFAAKLTARNK